MFGLVSASKPRSAAIFFGTTFAAAVRRIGR
jgi:hypothetical protein